MDNPTEAPKVEDQEKVQVPPTEEQQKPAEPTPEQVELISKKGFKHGMDLIDESLKGLGFEKPAGVKTTDFLASLLKKEEVKGTKDDKKPVEDTELSAKYKSLQDKYQERESELEELKGSVSKAKRDFWMDSLVAATPIYIPDHLSESEKARMKSRTEKLIKSELTNNYDIKEVDGKFVFYKDGQPVFDGTVDMNHISPQALISKEFSEYLTVAKEQPTKVTGTGSHKDDQKVNASVIPSKIKTVGEFYEYLKKEKGLTIGDAESLKLITKAKEERPAMFKV